MTAVSFASGDARDHPVIDGQVDFHIGGGFHVSRPACTASN